MQESSAGRSALDFERLYEHAPCGLLVTAPDGVIRHVNRTFCVWVGREAVELVGLKLQTLLTMGGRIFHQTHWGPLMDLQGSLSEVKLELRRKDGGVFPSVWSAIRRADGEAAVDEVVVTIAADRHKYEQELLQARRQAEELLVKEQATQRALAAVRVERDREHQIAEDRALFAEQMMAIVSHDLRNPLAVIKMNALLLSKGALSEKQSTALARLEASTQLALRLIADLLDFSRGRLGGRMQVRLDSIDFHGVVASALSDLRVAHPGRAIEHRASGAGACLGSADRLIQLIGNLVGNAISYGAPDRPIVVETAIDEDKFWLSVHNDGSPIPEDLLPLLFEPMSRGIAAAAGLSGSIGLGLFIVREIARAHGGEVAVVSSAEAGTRFTSVFPRAQEKDLAVLKRPLEPSADQVEQEQRRQAELDLLAIGEFEEVVYNDITRLAAEACDVPIALITLVDGDRQWFKSRVGLQITQTPREHAFCAHAIRYPAEVFVVEDAAADLRFAQNPLVTGEPMIRFYAGVPLVTSSGAALGTVCVIDCKPRTLDSGQIDLLRFLAKQAVERFEQQARKASE
jgi:sigma-B regulation protein RsbU (phosphoserine phosphatase)